MYNKPTFDPRPRINRHKQLEAKLGTTQGTTNRAKIEAQMEGIKKALRIAGYGLDGKPLQPLSV